MSWTKITEDPATWPELGKDVIINSGTSLLGQPIFYLGQCVKVKLNGRWNRATETWSFECVKMHIRHDFNKERVIEARYWHPIPPLE